RRQSKLSERYAHKHGLELDKKLTFRDLGTSAFRGKNLRQGELGDFIKLVRSGRIKAGSFLLVENLDRVSRGEPLEAFDLLRQLIQLGITVVTLSPDERVYSQETLRDLPTLMVALMTMHRGYDESATKSERILQAKANARKAAIENGTTMPGMKPAWV